SQSNRLYYPSHLKLRGSKYIEHSIYAGDMDTLSRALYSMPGLCKISPELSASSLSISREMKSSLLTAALSSYLRCPQIAALPLRYRRAYVQGKYNWDDSPEAICHGVSVHDGEPASDAEPA